MYFWPLRVSAFRDYMNPYLVRHFLIPPPPPLKDWLVVSRQVPERKLQRWYYQLPLLGWPWLFGLLIALLNVIGAGGGKVYRNTWYCTAWATSWVFVFILALTGFGFLVIACSMGSLTWVSKIVDFFLMIRRL